MGIGPKMGDIWARCAAELYEAVGVSLPSKIASSSSCYYVVTSTLRVLPKLRSMAVLMGRELVLRMSEIRIIVGM